MADSPVTINPAATLTNDVLHTLIYGVAVNAAEAAMIAEVPFLGFPVIKQINEFLLNLFAGKVYEAMALGATFAIIDAQTNAEAKAANDAAAQLKLALQGTDANQISQAKTNFETAFAQLLHYDGSASP